MKRVAFILATLAVLFACKPEESNTPDKPDVVDKTVHTDAQSAR